jgi:hypothetical protein
MSLRNDTLTIEKDLVEARKKKLLLQTPLIKQMEDENNTILCNEERQEVRQDSTTVKLKPKTLIPKKLKNAWRVKNNK